jgi:signal transduction histidine kinase
MNKRNYSISELQERISIALAAGTADTFPKSDWSIRELLEELNVYHQELEFQNDELRKSQLALEKSRAYAYELFDKAPVAYVILNDAFNIKRMNERFKFYFSKALVDLEEPVDFRRLIKPHDQDAFHHLVNGSGADGGKGLTLEVNGRFCFIQLEKGALDHELEWRLSLLDVHNEQLALEALTRSENRFRSLINLAPDVIATFTVGSGIIGFVSDRIAFLTSKPASMYVGGLFAHFVFKDDELKAQAFVSTFSESGQENELLAEAELRFVNDKGQTIWTQVVGKRVHDDKNGQDYVLCLIRPIQQQVEQRMVLESQNARLQNFAYIISHNISSYVANVDGLVQLITAEELSSEEAKELYSPLRNSSANLIEAVRHLNEILKIQKNSGLGKEKLGLLVEIEKVLSTLQGQLEASKLRVVLQVPESLEICIHPAYLQSILLNFCTNAIRYRKMEIPDPRLEIKATENDDKSVALVFKDNGIGMDMHVVENKLFGMFQTFHNHPESKGLGLFMVKNQVDAMGGKITFDSEVGQGSTFTVHIPYCEPAAAETIQP